MSGPDDKGFFTLAKTKWWPVDFCSGVSPSQAAKSRLNESRRAHHIATKANALMPTGVQLNPVELAPSHQTPRDIARNEETSRAAGRLEQVA
jgi:hypothetical protein